MSLCVKPFRPGVTHSNSDAGPRGPSKKKILGRGTKRACESPGSNPQRAPPTNKRLLAQCTWVPVTQNQTQETRQEHHKEGTNPPRSRRSPGPHSGQGRARLPVAHFGEITYSGISKKCSRKTKQKRKKKTRTREAQENSCRLASQEKGLRRSKENPKNGRGPEWHPEKNAKKQDARPKRAKQTKAAGHKQEKKPEKQVRVRGVLLLPDLCLLKRKNKNRNDVGENQRKRERPRKKTRPDIKRIFPNSFGSEPTKNKTKTEAKQKFAPENVSKKRP